MPGGAARSRNRPSTRCRGCSTRLLDISKLESGAIKVDLTDFEIAPLFEELRRDFAGVAASKGLRFSIDAPQRTACIRDAALLGQVLRNLLSNAIKYTQHGLGRIALRTARPATAHRSARHAASASRRTRSRLIFEEFYQIGVSPNSSRDGYGLGLSIVQRIARLLGLKIEVSSTPGKGSVFAFEVPAARSAATRRRRSAARARRRRLPMPARTASCWSRTSPVCAMPCACCSRSRVIGVTAAAGAAEALGTTA